MPLSRPRKSVTAQRPSFDQAQLRNAHIERRCLICGPAEQSHISSSARIQGHESRSAYDYAVHIGITRARNSRDLHQRLAHDHQDRRRRCWQFVRAGCRWYRVRKRHFQFGDHLGWFPLSLRPADEAHPYGHGKIDALTGIFSGCCLFATAAFIAYHSIIEIRTPHHSPAWFTLPVLIAVIVVKELLSRRVFAVADTLDSNALKGDAWHHRSDAVNPQLVDFGTVKSWGHERIHGVRVVRRKFILRLRLCGEQA